MQSVSHAALPPSHDAWDALLKKHVSNTGKVSYKGLKSDQVKFEAYLKTLSDNAPQASWSKPEAMAYWINAYNAFTIKLILDNYPIASITKISNGKPWDDKWIHIGDKVYSLNNIENDILRPQYKDARIHFAVNCAAKSCPTILNKAWTATNLEANLDQQAKKFLANKDFNQIGADKASVSKIFEWYAVDFGKLPDFLNKYASVKLKPDAKITYNEYNWALNE
jgi:hypothetical protein